MSSSLTKWVFKPTVSLVLGGVFYAGWLAAFLAAVRSENSAAKGALFFAAPVVTAAGFAVGVSLFERLTNSVRGGFARTMAWALVGCAAGAAAVFWYGPMLIVFTMLAGGTAAVLVREITLTRKSHDG